MGALSGRKIGVVGIGAMGRPMSALLVKAGADISIYDADPGRAKAFASEVGGRAVDKSGDLESDLIITMLPNSRIVESVLFGEGGLAGAMPSGGLVLEMSSGAPRQTEAMGARLAERGIGMVDAPVSGGVARAITGDLAIMVGGDAENIARAQPVLQVLGSSQMHTGPLGSAHAMKALNNLVSAAGFLIGVEALLVGKQFGLDPSTMVDVLNASTGMNNSTQKKFKQFVLSRTFSSGFALDLMKKDLSTALALASDLDVEVPFSSQCLELWSNAAQMLGPGTDHTAITLACERIAGADLKPH